MSLVLRLEEKHKGLMHVCEKLIYDIDLQSAKSVPELLDREYNKLKMLMQEYKEVHQ